MWIYLYKSKQEKNLCVRDFLTAFVCIDRLLTLLMVADAVHELGQEAPEK